MYLNRFKPFLAILSFVLLSFVLGSIGCGGGSQSVGVTQVDTAGITSTVNGFMQSLRSGNPESFFSPTLRSQESVSGGIQTLKIWDFGSDINNPDDNNYHYFTIPQDGINQISDDFATVYATKDVDGRTFRVDFELVKIDGSWFIETIKFTGSSSSVINAASLLPLQRGNVWKSIMLPADSSSSISSPVMVSGEISSDPVVKDSQSVFYVSYTSNSTALTFNLSNYSSTLSTLKTTDSWPILKAAYQPSSSVGLTTVRSGIIDLFSPNPSARELGYANQNGLFQYGASSFNAGQPVQFLSAAPVIGEIATKTVFVEINGATYEIFLASRLARKVSILTFAGPFEAYQVDAYVRFVNSFPLGQHQEMYWTRLFAADNGEVAQVEWDGTGVARYIYLLYSSVVNGRTVSPLDSGSSPTTNPFAFIAGTTLNSATIGQSFSQTLVEGGATPYTHSVLSGALPSGLTISGGSIVGTPSQEGSFNFNLQFTDAAGTTISRAFALTVSASSGTTLAFVPSTATLPSGAVGSTYNQVLVTGGTQPYTFSTVTLPAGLAFSSNGLSGVPTSANSFLFTVTVADAAGNSINREFSLVIGQELQFSAATPLSTGTVGKSFSATIAIGGVSPVSLSLDSGSLPSGLSFSQALLSGSPATAGSFSFTVRVTDASGRAITRAYTMQIVNPPSFALSSPLPVATINGTYNQTLIADGVKPYSISFTGGTSLPGGLTLGTDGVISGTTTAAAGTYSFSVVVSDTNADIISGTFSITVVAPFQAVPAVKWTKVYGSTSGSADYYETATRIIPVSGGGYLVVGHVSGADASVTGTHGGGQNDVWIIRINDLGEITWQAIYGGAANDEAYGVVQADDNNFLIVGTTNSTTGTLVASNGSYDSFAMKISSADGSVIWSKVYGGTGVDKFLAVSKMVFPEPGILVAGTTTSQDGDLSSAGVHYFPDRPDAWVARIDPANGNILFQKAYGGTYNDEAQALAIDGSGNIYFAGLSSSTDGDRASGAVSGNGIGVSDVWVVKLDSTLATFGNILWQKSYGGSSSDLAHAMKIDNGGNLILSGETSSTDVSGYHSGTDLWLAKIGADGTLAWQRAFGGTFQEQGFDVQFFADGSYLAVGAAGSSDGDVQGAYGNWDAWMLKVDTTGAVLNWQKPYGGTSSEKFRSVVLVNGLLTAVGTTNSSDNDLNGLRSGTNYDWWMVQFQ
ncbi:MAG: Ig domain-containing protein [Candidatus Riflebacteria bacterium]